MDCCTIVADRFDAEKVASRLDERRSHGPAITTRRIVAALSAYPCERRSPLDIGAGFGDVQCALFARGLASAMRLDPARHRGRTSPDV